MPADVVKERYQRLVTLVEDIAWDEAKTQLGRTVEVLIAEGEGRKDGATGRLSGRARDNRLVHFSLPEAAQPDAIVGEAADVPRPGDMATVIVTYAAPHHLVGTAETVVRTRAGDAWELRNSGDDGCGVPTASGAAAAAGPVVLGLPVVGQMTDPSAPSPDAFIGL